MRRTILIFIIQYGILCNQYNYIIGKALMGQTVMHALPNEFSFIVAFLPLNAQSPPLIICSGSLLTYYHILTAEHCFDEIALTGLRISVGSHNLDTGISYFPYWFISFDQWSNYMHAGTSDRENDVAVLKLINSAPWDIIPARLSSIASDDLLYGLRAQISGWGLTNNGQRPNTLLKGEVNILTPQYCTNLIAQMRRLHSNLPIMFLCSNNNPPLVVGKGDSGGSLIYNGEIIAVTKGKSPPSNEVLVDFVKINIHVSINMYRNFINQHLCV